MSETHVEASRLAALLAGVDPGYRHYPKRATPGATLELPAVALKWYEIHREGAPVPDPIRVMARAHLEAKARAGTLEARGLGFVLLHRCGTDFHFLIVCTWNQSNELWESVDYKDGDAMPAFARFPREGAHAPVLCVWELGPVQHEQAAWQRLLDSPRGEADVRAYLESRFAGTV